MDTRDISKTAIAQRDLAGTAALELGLISPVFVLLFIGIYSFGLYFGALIAITNTAAEGARASMIGLNDVDRSSLATAAANATFAKYSPFLNPSYLTITAQADPKSAQRFQVSVSYDFTSFGLLKLSNFALALPQKPSVVMTAADAGCY